MQNSYKEFDRSNIKLLPLSERKHDLNLNCILPVKAVEKTDNSLKITSDRIKSAREKSASVILMMGAHVLRAGVQRYIIDLMEKGYIDCIAMNGAGAIHDYEFALVGATTESVPYYIKDGRFGMWRETGKINDIVADGYKRGYGLGESVGKYIEENDLPQKDISIFAAGYRLSMPITVHAGIGYDIIHQHANCDGAAWGGCSYKDFLRFAAVVENLQNGVVMNFGSAVMAPEVYLKALSMSRNAARQQGKSINKFTTLVCDLINLPDDYSREAPKSCHSYYFRPYKTMLVRTVADGGESYYVKGNHRKTIPELWTNIINNK